MIVAVLTALFFWRVRAPLPVTSGTVAVDGLRGRVEIIRDLDDIPHIRASDEADALFGLGYVHAQERLWQMEFQRRVAQGRLSEVVGPEGLPADRLLRTIGLMRAAREAWPKIDGRSRALIEAYVAGHQRLPRGPPWRRAAGRIRADAHVAGALDRRGRGGVAEDDGAGSSARTGGTNSCACSSRRGWATRAPAS